MDNLWISVDKRHLKDIHLSSVHSIGLEGAIRAFKRQRVVWHYRARKAIQSML